MNKTNSFNWLDLAFNSKKELRNLDAIFVAAPRRISQHRIKQLVKEYLPKNNIVFGIAKELFIENFEGQDKFKTLNINDIKDISNKVIASSSPNKVYTLQYCQRDLPNIIAKNLFKKILFLNGSWANSFHTRPEYYQLIKNVTKYELISPFYDENEAKQYALNYPETDYSKQILGTKREVMELSNVIAQDSFDTATQCGAVIVSKTPEGKYKVLIQANNVVVPYRTYAWHFGASKEKNFAPPGDLNYYDTVHAEVMAIINAQQQQKSLINTSLFINMLPCPTCAKMLALTDINELYYSVDHSDGYAVKMLELAGKKVHRLVL